MNPSQTILDFTAARGRRDAGMASSLAHALSDCPTWAEQAFRLLVQYVSEHTHPFTIEHFRPWAYMHGLPRPVEERAFGGVTCKALKAGVIVKVGYAPAASSNNSPKALYARPAATLPNVA